MRTLLSLICGLVLPVIALAQNAPPPPSLVARSWLLIDHASGQILASQNPEERAEPASLTKLMTAYLTFSALKQGKLKLDQVVPVSERAWARRNLGGSLMFIDPKTPVTVDQLIHGMIIQSGNDACIALAEAVSGSEEAFVATMNREAQRLGLTQTRFANTTGLTDAQHYSTALDLARLTQALIRDFPEYYPIYSIKEYTYNRITQMNRNRLLRVPDAQVDGVKTGHTSAAGYCLISSSKRAGRRLISVVMGANSEESRARESLNLLTWGFLNFDAVKLYDKGQAVAQLKTFKGTQATVKAGFLEDLTLSLPKGMADRIKVQLESRQPLVAPIQTGQQIGTLKINLDGKPWGEQPVVALEDVPLAGIFGRAWDSLRLWLQ
jgi:D-alanyl-D-alanine carboxypeptidase (penicillin-binding protein 5/6)